MKKDVKIPPIGESITEAILGKWRKQSGERVEQNEIILEVESDKATVEVAAEMSGVLTISVESGKTVAIGSVVGFVDSDATASVAASTVPSETKPSNKTKEAPLSPSARRLAEEKKVDTSTIQGTGRDGRLTKKDVMNASEGGTPLTANMSSTAAAQQAQYSVVVPGAKRVPMSPLRKKIAERLVEAQQTAAILTTFNEVDLGKVMELRNKYKVQYLEKYSVRLGFMGFFTKAVTEALKAYPILNAVVDGTDILYHENHNIGIAVGTEKGLIVPVIRNAQKLSIAQIELSIKHFADKARDGKITVDDLRDGTFTITNGGVYGSLLSTPILNPPQSGILGMHKIQERPMVVGGKIEIRPMMYVALSYDHRIIDGKEAVSFLVRVKEDLENPERLLLEI